MADSKLTGLTANTTPVLTDLLYMVDDPAGTPLSQKITVSNVFSAAGLYPAADVIEQRNGITAQNSYIYNTYTNASNYERGRVGWSGDNFYFETQKLGTGADRSIRLQATNNVDLITGGGGNSYAFKNAEFVANGAATTLGSSSQPWGDIFSSGGITTGAPSGGTAAKFKVGVAAVVSPTSPNRTIQIDIAGTIYYLHAKTTNN